MTATLPSVLVWLRQSLWGSLRSKLVALSLLPLLIAVPLVVLLLAGGGSIYLDRLLVAKIRSDLAVAHSHFDQVRASVGHQVQALAASHRLGSVLRTRPDTLPALLQQAAAELKIDYLILIDAKGQVLAASAARQGEPPLNELLVVRRALSGVAGTEIDVLDTHVLAAMDAGLPQKARTTLIATRNALPSERREEVRGMVVQSAAPVGGVGRFAGGVLLGGLLLNKNLAFVDRINETVYPDGALPLGSVGTATLFLDDVRIATNVRLFGDQRAIGTRVSAAVREAVLEQGRTWLDRAFVVNAWYVSAYEPIHDGNGQSVGMLYVGFLEEPFKQAQRWAMGMVMALFVLTCAVVAGVSLRLARHISAPIERMHQTMSLIESGQPASRVGTVAGDDEMAQLAVHLDRLLDQLAHQTEALRRWGSSLDCRVAEVTQNLVDANQSLRSAQQRMVMTEKLAAIGQLAAGVAHEVNNPVAVIQGNLDVLRETLGDKANLVLPEIRLIQDQVFRIRLIVTKLLQFTKPSEYAGFVEPVDLTQVVRDSLVLVEHQMKREQIRVEQDLQALQRPMINRGELQQILINLMVNALQAMQGGTSGLLTLATRDCTRGNTAGIELRVTDSGPGIAAADRSRLFDPFFTTKAADGNGLGLWVSQSLVERYGGRIELNCPDGGGCIFNIWIPLQSKLHRTII
ncbi:MAG: cache domain-containing protein [Rhodoferax sp.]|nr:cache domain-containing protein [Rhodoferax sp.]MBP8182605.1 cache domain-containing protein [Rhodoferax sp.]